MQILRTDINLEFAPKPNECQWILSTELPPLDLSTSALALLFDADHLLMTQLATRDWDIPGGHIEDGETPQQTVEREIYEETCCVARALIPFAHQKITLYGNVPAEYKYPYPTSYQIIFISEVEQLDPFVATVEALDWRLLPPDQVQNTQWVQKNRELYDAAVASRQSI